jgi:hypothetical protein
VYKEVRRVSPDAGMGMLMGLFSAGRGMCSQLLGALFCLCHVFAGHADPEDQTGIGAVLSGPVSELLMEYGGFDTGGLTTGYGTSYGALIVFTGVTAACGVICFGARMGVEKIVILER